MTEWNPYDLGKVAKVTRTKSKPVVIEVATKNNEIERLRSLISELREGIGNARDLVRTGCAPDALGMTQEDWMRHKLIKVGGELDALMSKVDEVMG